MLLVLSPSKTLDYESPLPTATYSLPAMLEQSEQLIKTLRGYSKPKLAMLTSLSDKLAALNHQRYQDFSPPFTPNNARPALLAFKGDVYEGMDVTHYSDKDFAFAQEHLRILSGLYGLLRPLDLMQPYRLEMGTKLATNRGKDLYEFWGDSITDAINLALAKHKNKTLINLASGEYFKAVRPAKLDGELLTIHFKERKGNDYKIIGIHAKRARGLMADFIIRNRIDTPKELTGFSAENYGYQPQLSNSSELIFTR